jgi:hypothetical protein
MLALELIMRLIFRLRLLQPRHLRFGQHQAPSALSRFFIVSRSWRSHTQRTPAAEMTSARRRNSLTTRTCPKAGCSIARATTASSSSRAKLGVLLLSARVSRLDGSVD